MGCLNVWIYRYKYLLEIDGGLRKDMEGKMMVGGYLYKFINILMLNFLFCIIISELVFKN